MLRLLTKDGAELGTTRLQPVTGEQSPAELEPCIELSGASPHDLAHEHNRFANLLPLNEDGGQSHGSLWRHRARRE